MSEYQSLAWGVGAVVLLVIWFVVIPLGLRGIFDALGASRTRAWVPFVNLATVYRLGGLSEYWLIVLVIPPATVVGLVLLFVASHRIARRLDHSAWFTVLAVVMWWAWTLAIGLQHERGARAAASEPLVWSVQRPEASLRLPGSDDATPSASRPIAPERRLTARLEALSAEAPFHAAPLDPPEPELPELPALPEPPAEASAPELPHLPELEPEDDATILTNGDATILTRSTPDQTVISARRRPHWWVHTAMGSRVELVGTAAILGRRPKPHPLYPGAQLVMVTDDAVSVSATHAVLEYVEEAWHVTDLGSTNGVWLVDPATGAEREIGAHNRHRVTPRFLLGELGVQVVRNA
ncbi:FHA domain-containing protein [Gryllotalpicola reticulitermitis]|uniref:FHA domain-containing protein n=1 Tax=Gryllotalpicola reticulitermitis TaxID=1184153 RepID=A0ABV8Q282_9MICO